MAALPAFGGTAGVLVLAGSGFMPARLLLVPAGTRLPPGVHAVAAVPSTAVVASVGSGSRAMGLVARAAAGADHGIPSGVLASLSLDDATDAGALASLSIGDATNAGVLAALSIDGATNAGVLSSLSLGDSADAGVLASLSIDDVTNAGVLSSLSLGDSTNAGVLASLSLGDSTGAAAGCPARGSAGAGGRLLFLGGDASAGFGFGISSAALASAAGRRASRGGELVVAATAGSGSEADGGVDNGSTADSTKLDQFLVRKNAVLLSWDSVEVDRDYSPRAFFGDVKQFQESANKGLILMRILLDAGLDYSNVDMWVLSYAGQCLRRVVLQAERGFVYDAAIVEATQAVHLVCARLLPDVSAGSAVDPSVAYSKQRAQDFTKVIDGVQVAVA